jgi:Glycosyl hydrolases family 18
MPEVGGASETDRMPDAERTAGLKRPQGDDRASEVRNWFQPGPLADSAEAAPADSSAANPSPTDAAPVKASPAGKATPAGAGTVPAERPATTGQARGSSTGSGSAARTETYTEPDTVILPKLRISPPQAQSATGRPRAATSGQVSAEAKTLPPSAPARAQTPPASAPARGKRPPSPTGSGSNGSGAAGRPRGYYSGAKSPAWPDALNEGEPETVILPKLFVSRPPPGHNGAARTGGPGDPGQRLPAGAKGSKAVQADGLAEPETMLLPVVQDIPSDSGSATGRRSSRKARAAARAAAAAATRKSPGTTRKGPVKLIASLGRRLKQGTGRHRPLIVAMAAIVAIAAAATVMSVRLDASPRPAGAPPMDIPTPVSKGQVVQVATSSTWPTTPPASVPAGCKQPTLKGTDGASVLSYLDDNSTQHSLVATEAKGLDLLDFSWTSLASPTNVVRSDSFDSSLTTELTAANKAGPCGLRFATLSDNYPTMNHSADVRMMTQMLTSSSVRHAHVLAVAQWMASQPLATGLTIDYQNGLPQNLTDLKTAEQAAGWSGLSLDEAVSRLTNDYTALIGEIAAAMHRQHRLVRLMAPVRDSDDVDAATTDIAPYLLDYGALAQYVDQIVLQAYNFSYATSNPGPIAPFADVARVLAYVHSYNVPWSKLAVAEPSFAYNWTVNKNGNIAVNAKGQVISATTLNATQVAADKKQWHEEKTENGETEYSYTQNGQKHVVWDASSALKTEMAWLKRTYSQIGVDVSQIGNADPTGSALAVTALRS